MFDLTGRVALVTGAGQGIGAGIAEMLGSSRRGSRRERLHPDRRRDTVDQLIDLGARAVAVPFDVTDEAAVADRASEPRPRALGGPIDVLVNNAGVPLEMSMQQFVDMDPSEWHRCVDLNMYGSHAIASGPSCRP